MTIPELCENQHIIFLYVGKAEINPESEKQSLEKIRSTQWA